mmetsp:Transcript_172231/g.546815  ORF Transcript_172231/g.546815 Transcript_172231/m.546815 type:complete len:808 (-) Transcript_172231:50-2473(-)
MKELAEESATKEKAASEAVAKAESRAKEVEASAESRIKALEDELKTQEQTSAQALSNAEAQAKDAESSAAARIKEVEEDLATKCKDAEEVLAEKEAVARDAETSAAARIKSLEEEVAAATRAASEELAQAKAEAKERKRAKELSVEVEAWKKRQSEEAKANGQLAERFEDEVEKLGTKLEALQASLDAELQRTSDAERQISEQVGQAAKWEEQSARLAKLRDEEAKATQDEVQSFRREAESALTKAKEKAGRRLEQQLQKQKNGATSADVGNIARIKELEGELAKQQEDVSSLAARLEKCKQDASAADAGSAAHRAELEDQLKKQQEASVAEASGQASIRELEAVVKGKDKEASDAQEATKGKTQQAVAELDEAKARMRELELLIGQQAKELAACKEQLGTTPGKQPAAAQKKDAPQLIEDDSEYIEACSVVDETNSELARLMLASQSAPKKQKQELLKKIKDLEEAPAFQAAARFLEDPSGELGRRRLQRLGDARTKVHAAVAKGDLGAAEVALGGLGAAGDGDGEAELEAAVQTLRDDVARAASGAAAKKAAMEELAEAERSSDADRLTAALADARRLGASSGKDLARAESALKGLAAAQAQTPEEAEERRKRLEARKAKKSGEDAPATAAPATEKAAAAAAEKAGFAFEPSSASEQEVPRTLNLRVDVELGAGIDALPTWFGMVVEEIEHRPGQEGLRAGDCISSIAGVSLREMEDCEGAFSENLCDCVEVIVEPHCETRGVVPAGCSNINWSTLLLDVEKFAADYQVTLAVAKDRRSVSMSGPQSAVVCAREAATELLTCYFS